MDHFLYDAFTGTNARLEQQHPPAEVRVWLRRLLVGPLRTSLGSSPPPDGLARVVDAVMASCGVLVGDNLTRSQAHQLPELNPYWAAFRQLLGLDLRLAVLRQHPPPRRLLISGETGTGKEGVARFLVAGLQALEGGSQQRTVSAVEFVPELLQAELFGAVKGAYTGSLRDRPGVLESLKPGGVLFLDELGKTTLTFQAQLLRVLQSGEARRVGADAPRSLGRQHLVAATSRSLAELQDPQVFRPDLLHRFGGGHMRLPPLRALIAGYPMGERAFFKQVAAQEVEALAEGMAPVQRDGWLGRNPGARVGVSLARIAADYAWPGNLRQLRSVIQRALMEGPDRVDELMDEQRELHPGDVGRGRRPPGGARLRDGLRSHLEAEERRCYAAAVAQARSLNDVARALKVSRQTADRRLKHFELKDLLSARKAGSA